MPKKKSRPSIAARPSAAQMAEPVQAPRKPALWPDALNIAALVGLAIYFVQLSWFKWPDPLIDFGRELYLPWRITQGAVLYRDELHLYGPLSPYLNSLVFRVGGVGLTTLVAANLIVYGAILGLLYYLVRAGWGRWAAFTSCAMFIGVFSFSHLVGVDNYNFLTPYSHEMTHGTLLVLCLVLALRLALRELRPMYIAAAGLFAGTSLLMKPEIIMAATVVSAGGALLSIQREIRHRAWGRWLGAAGIFIAASLVPMTLAALLFWSRGGFSLRDGYYYANFAWQSLFRLAVLIGDPFQRTALGFDQPWRNLGVEAAWGAGVVALAGGIAWAILLFRRGGAIQKGLVLAGLALAGVGVTQVQWMNVGYALPGILLAGAAIEIVRMRAAPGGIDSGDGATVRALLWTAAAAMLARMALNPRIFHYGFVQAALAGVVGVAILVSSIPRLLKLDRRSEQGHQAVLTLLVGCFIVVVASNSTKLYSFHTLSVASGANQFYAFNENADPTGLLVEQAREYLEKDKRENKIHSLLVLPEGIILNYLTQLPNTIPYYFFAPFVLADGRGDEIVRGLEASPPDRIVVLSRDMREFGVARFGDSPEHGQGIVDFVNRNYQAVYLFGDKDPLDPDKVGLLVFARKAAH